MSRLPAAPLALVLGAAACDINNKNADALSAPADDASEPEDTTVDPVADTSEEPDTSEPSDAPTYTVVSGCDWLAGTWLFADCRTAEAVELKFSAVGSCQYQVTGPSPLIVGAAAWAEDSGFMLVLNDGQRCQGFFDGEHLDGTCAAVGLGAVDPCWFTAVKK